jgi:hypothetical protein
LVGVDFNDYQRKGEDMKTLISRFSILAVLIGTLAACGAMAQNNIVVFTAPAVFHAGQATFPVGTYTLRQFGDDPSVWEILSDSKSASAVFVTEPMDTTASASKTELTFHKYGNTLVLKQIWIQGQVTGYIVQTSYAERKAAKGGKPTIVTVPAQKK